VKKYRGVTIGPHHFYDHEKQDTMKLAPFRLFGVLGGAEGRLLVSLITTLNNDLLTFQFDEFFLL
jgi:hypothetical protein